MSLLSHWLGLKSHPVPGGIRAPAYKLLSLRSRIMSSPIPDRLLLPLRQHQGPPATPLVKVGEQVLKYQLLASADEEFAVPLHAPTSGTITAIAAAPANQSEATQQGKQATDDLCIYLESDGKDNAITLQPLPDYRSSSPSELLQLLAAAGLSGLGGGGFSSAVKLNLGRVENVHTLIINAVECEPYISADEALLREHAVEVVAGAEILQSICLAPQCVIAIEKDKRDAISALRDALGESSIQLRLLPVKYPTGGERQLVQAITGTEVGSGKLPIDSGCLVHNTGTAYATWKAIVQGQPCISRVTTVTGLPLQTPKNFEVLIGTPIAFLFELCGIDSSIHKQTIVGGSLMGCFIEDLQSPVIKTTNCLVATAVEEFPDSAPEQACIRCGKCADVCPARLLPQQLYAYARGEDFEQLLSHGLGDCIECGACAYVCPSHIPLVQYYRASKQSMKQAAEQRQLSEHWQNRFQYHQYRSTKLKDAAGVNKKLPGKSGNKSDNKSSNKSSNKEAANPGFSRSQARTDIAAAVARVKQRRSQVIASSSKHESDEK